MRRLLVFTAAALIALQAQAEQRSLPVPPHATDARLRAEEPPHWVTYDPVAALPLLVWLPGTNGRPAESPKGVLRVALDGGYRVIGLSYLNGDAVG